MKKLTILGVVAASSLALAAFSGVLSEGHGGALARDGRVATFDYRIGLNESGQAQGQLRFEQVANEHGRRVVIEMGMPAGASADAPRCHFRGPGVLSTVDAAGNRHTARGAIEVSVADLHTRTHPDGVDRFEIHFTGREGNVSYEFAGAVKRGDLFVNPQ